MEGSQIGLVAIRGALFVCACIVLGISAHFTAEIDAYKGSTYCVYHYCNFDGLGPRMGYGVFVGLWGLIQVAVGLAAIFANGKVPWIAIAVVDALALIFYFAGGIAVAVWLGHVICSQGTLCSLMKTNDAFMWLGFLITIAAVAFLFLGGRKK